MIRATLSPGTVDWQMARCNLPAALRRKGSPGLVVVIRGATTYLAYRDEGGDLAGLLFCRHGHFTIAVRPDSRRRGIGSLLITEALRQIPGLDLAAQHYTPAGAALARAVAWRNQAVAR